MERRDFIKTGCKLCLLSISGLSIASLAACSASKSSVYKTEIQNNLLSVPLNLFDANAMQFVRPKGWYFDIAVEKHEDNSYSALLMKCTHMDNQLNASPYGFSCSLHGSSFAKDGHVTHGPAERPLKQYRTTINNENLIIHI